MTGRQPRPDDRLILFPKETGAQVEVTDQQGRAAVVGLLSGLSAPMVMLAQRLAKSPTFAQARAVVGYRLRKAPRDVVRLGWFFLRGHGRWIAKGWTWAPMDTCGPMPGPHGWPGTPRPAGPLRS
jgi:hypothetical protein